MSLPLNRQLTVLPRRFPVGSIYVVEGRGGEYGHLRVSSRYVILPGGERIDVQAKPGRAELAGTLRWRRLRPSSPPQNQVRIPLSAGPKESSPLAKKFALSGGTTRRERR